MPYRLLILSLFAWVGWTIFSFPPLSLLFLVLSVKLTPSTSLIAAFFGGLFLDFTSGTAIGVHALFYLFVTAASLIYLRKISAGNVWYLAIMAVALSLCEYLFLLRFWQPLLIFLSPLIVLTYFRFLKKYSPDKENR